MPVSNKILETTLRLFLSEDELAALTGTEDRGEQKKILRSNRVPCFRAKDGSLRVSRKVLEPDATAREKIERPNFDKVPSREKRI